MSAKEKFRVFVGASGWDAEASYERMFEAGYVAGYEEGTAGDGDTTDARSSDAYWALVQRLMIVLAADASFSPEKLVADAMSVADVYARERWGHEP